jgi:hypothetical protein
MDGRNSSRSPWRWRIGAYITAQVSHSPPTTYIRTPCSVAQIREANKEEFVSGLFKRQHKHNQRATTPQNAGKVAAVTTEIRARALKRPMTESSPGYPLIPLPMDSIPAGSLANQASSEKTGQNKADRSSWVVRFVRSRSRRINRGYAVR